MIVDYLRSCHHGTWRFYGNRPDVTTPGRFYFVPESNPHLPFPHPFQSYSWRIGDVEPDVVLGEQRSGPHPYSNGRFGAGTLPPPVAVGQAGDFVGALTWPLPAPVGRLVNGVPELCWTQVNASLVPPEDLCAIDSCCLRVAMARVVELTYDADVTRLETFFTTWLGAGITQQYSRVAGLIPGFHLVVHPQYSIVICSGTTSYQQLATQVFTALTGPTNFGNYSSLPLHHTAATRLDEALNTLGANQAAPILLVGHSYGAAAVGILAGRYRAANELRDVCLITYGCPKPGDDRLARLLNNVNAAQIAAVDDFVTMLPPDIREVFPFVGLVGNVIARAWTQWRPFAHRLNLDAAGNVNAGPAPVLDAVTLGPMIAAALAHVPLPPYQGHLIETYVARLFLQCSVPCYPMNAQLWGILFGVNQVVLTSPDQAARGSLLFTSITLQEVNFLLSGNSPTPTIVELAGASAPLPGASLLIRGDALFNDGLLLTSPIPMSVGPGPSCPACLAQSASRPSKPGVGATRLTSISFTNTHSPTCMAAC